MGVWMLLLLLLLCGGASSAASIYLSSWAVRVPSGAQEAQRLARRHGLLYLGQNNDVTPDLNVLTAWSQGYTGLGVVVSILDDGVEKNHPDLVANYDPLASYDFNDNDPDPQPRYNRWNENSFPFFLAGTGKLAKDCVRMLDGDVNDIVEAQSLSLQPQHIDIYSASWGPEDDGKTGRGGLGSLFVWASGNGGLRKDNCNCDGYTNSIYTLSVGSSTKSGRVPWYNEACASTLTTTYSSGAKGEKQIVTTDLRHACTSSHTGTSASAPLAAGLIALALEANPALTWRDMQHLVVRASSPAHLQADDWAVNGAGRKVSHYYGYGLLDGGALVEMARRWQRSWPQRKCFLQVVSQPIGMRSLEHVQVQLWLTYSRRGDLAISLTSPRGTTSTLVDVRPYDTSRDGYKDWDFMSTHYWDEDPRGVWTLLLENKGDVYNRECPSPLFAVRHLCLSYCPPRYYRLSRRALDPNGTQRAIQACSACDPSCYTCLAGTARNCSACPSHSTYEERSHTCLPSPSFSYLPRGGAFALGDRPVFLLALAVLLALGPVACCVSYALCRTRQKRARPDGETEAVSLELLYLHRPGAEESLNRLS
ncbi:hypothetical protein Chor_008363 [Crotalus horridus]